VQVVCDKALDDYLGTTDDNDLSYYIALSIKSILRRISLDAESARLDCESCIDSESESESESELDCEPRRTGKRAKR
jgi:hypothetical protein